MNFLGHLYFSDNDIPLMYANMYGDFVKGSNLDHLTSEIKLGVLLHRKIDHYIDNHAAVIELMHSLYPRLPKVTGIAIDLFFDHLLAKNWSQFHAFPYHKFLENFYAYDISDSSDYSKEFKDFCFVLKSNNWMLHYESLYGLRKMCEGVSSRISFENELHHAPIIFNEFQNSIESTFFTFMMDAESYFQKTRTELKLQLLDK
jgi:acyl carrier protein phosphodiesterase